MGCFKLVLDKLKKDVQRKMGNLSTVKISDEKFERLSERSSDKSSRDFKLPTWIEEANNPRVAMDFSYGVGRVVDDPKEAAEIARGETRGSSCQRTRFQSLTPAPPESLRFGPHLTQSYYHGNIGRVEAEELIVRNGTNGVFLLRDSINRPGCLVITYLHAHKPYHQYVMPVVMNDKISGEYIYLATCDKDTVFYDVHSLIEYYRLNKGCLQTVLKVSIKNSLQPDATPLRHRKPGPSSPRDNSPRKLTPSKPPLRASKSPQQNSDSEKEESVFSTAECALGMDSSNNSSEPINKTSSPLLDLLTSSELNIDTVAIIQPISPQHPASETDRDSSPRV